MSRIYDDREHIFLVEQWTRIRSKKQIVKSYFLEFWQCPRPYDLMRMCWRKITISPHKKHLSTAKKKGRIFGVSDHKSISVPEQYLVTR